jgi:hypothetical protein
VTAGGPFEFGHDGDLRLPIDAPDAAAATMAAKPLESFESIMAKVRQAIAAAEQLVVNEINKFKSAVDCQGNLLHPHFDELEEAMTLLVEAAIAAKQPVPPLEDLYATALRTNQWALEMAVATSSVH